VLHAKLRKLVLLHERGTAKALGGRTMPGSGNRRNQYLKGDVSSKHFRVENKLTLAASYSLTRAVLDKIEHEALSNCQTPVVALQIAGEQYAVLRWQDFHSIATDAGML